MTLSNTAQYAINIMVAITQHHDVKPLNAKAISEQFNIPYKYLTRIMPKLVNAKLITSTKGREGGYSLAQKSNKISVSEILLAINEDLHYSKCILKEGQCDVDNKCALHDQWKVPKKSIKLMFTGTMLEDMVSK